MKEYGLTQTEIAAISGISRLKITRIISGTTPLRVDILLLLLESMQALTPMRFFNRLRKTGFKYKMEISC